MFCTNCGAELKDGAKFCHACGAAADGIAGGAAETPAASGNADVDRADDARTTEAAAGAEATRPETGFAGQVELGNNGRRKFSPLAIVVLALALIACIALVIALITLQTNGGERPSAQEQPAPAQAGSSEGEGEGAGAEAEPERELTDEERAIASLDGWWRSAYHHEMMGYQPCYGNVHDAVIDWYRYEPDAGDVSYGSTVAITRAERFAENGAEGWRFFTDTSNGDSWAYYEADGEENDLPVYQTAFGYGVIDEAGYNIYSPERYGMSRVDAASLGGDESLIANEAEVFARAQKLAEARASEASSSGGDDVDATFDQAAAEAEAREAAVAAGKQVFDGTIHIVDADTRMQKVGAVGALPSGSGYVFAYLQIDAPTTVTVRNGDGGTAASEPYRTREGVETILLGTNSQSSSTATPWKAYDGQRVAIACDKSEMNTFSDVTGALFDVNASSAQRIAPLTEADAGVASGDYILPDSATRLYPTSELEALDVHTLFLARNEIYARHGRQFQSAELQQYFGSKGWYSGTIPASAFDEGSLSQVEKDNANAMLAIEKARNSPYLG